MADRAQGFCREVRGGSYPVVTALGFFTTVAYFYYLSQHDDRTDRGDPEVDA